MASSSTACPKWEVSLLTPCQSFFITSVNYLPFLGHFLMLGGHLLLLAALLFLLHNKGSFSPCLRQRWDQAVTLSKRCMCVCRQGNYKIENMTMITVPQSIGHTCLSQGSFLSRSEESKTISLHPFQLERNMPAFQCSVSLWYLPELKPWKLLNRF